jgi:hypothetical protein
MGSRTGSLKPWDETSNTGHIKLIPHYDRKARAYDGKTEFGYGELTSVALRKLFVRTRESNPDDFYFPPATQSIERRNPLAERYAKKGIKFRRTILNNTPLDEEKPAQETPWKQIDKDDPRVKLLKGKSDTPSGAYVLFLQNVDKLRSQGLSDREIYAKLARHFHPDTSDSKNATMMIAVINGAYDKKNNTFTA